MQDQEDRTVQIRKRLDGVSPSFCLAKWLQVTLHLHQGRTHSCHHPVTHKVPLDELEKSPSALHNTNEKKQYRRQMLQGERPKECDYCWRIEDSSVNSISDRHIKSADDWAEPFFEKVQKTPWDANIEPSYLEVNFDNICNLRCSYCSSDISSSWADEVERLGPFRSRPEMTVENLKKIGKLPWSGPPETNPYVQAFWKWWPELAPKLKVFRITGGEPLLSEETFRVFQSLIDEPRPELELAINSNLMVPKGRIDRFINLGRQIIVGGLTKRLDLFTSVDTWGAQAEYIRNGLRHDYFWANVRRVLTEVPNLNLTLMCTFNALSVSQFSQLLDHVWNLKQEFQRIAIDISFLRHPEHQSVKILPPEYITQMRAHVDFMEARRQAGAKPGFSNYEIEKMRRLCLWMEIPEDTNWVIRARKNFNLFFSEHDQRRGTNFLATFPEMKNFWEECRLLPEEVAFDPVPTP